MKLVCWTDDLDAQPLLGNSYPQRVFSQGKFSHMLWPLQSCSQPQHLKTRFMHAGFDFAFFCPGMKISAPPHSCFGDLFPVFWHLQKREALCKGARCSGKWQHLC